MMWYLANAGRFRAEQEALRALAAEVDWLEVDGWRIDQTSHLCVNAEINAAGRSFPLVLRYSLHFPFTPPSVQPRTPERWSDHQYGRGELCLEYGPDNWRPEITGADMLRSAERLLRTQGEGTRSGLDAVPSRHSTTPGQDLRHSSVRLLLTDSLRDFLERQVIRGQTSRVKYWALSRDKSYVVVPKDILDVDGSGSTWTDTSVPAELERYTHKWDGLLFSLPEGVAVPDFATGAELKDYLKPLGFAPPAGYAAEDIEFILVRGDAAPELLWIGKNGEIHRHPTISPSRGQRLDADHLVLSTRTVGIVGCGSVGSKVATALARSGVRTFVLIDDDVLTPDNLVRHELDWTSMGEHKADAVARHLALAAPGTTCTVRRQRLGGQEANGLTDWSLTQLGECDLLVDATSSSRVFNLLAGVAQVAKRPLVWAEVFAGGIGGLVARSRPGLDPDPQTVRARVNAWCDERNMPVPQAGVDYDALRDGVPLIADDADVSVIAGHTARLCIDLLIGREPSWFPVSAYLIGLACDWIFKQPFHTFPVDVGAPAPLPQQEEPVDPTHIEAIVQLMLNGRDETAPSS